MKLLIDTSLDHLFINLMDDAFITKDSVLLLEKRKADKLPVEVKSILSLNNISIKEIDQIFITLGPGSFMGARTALVYARTIAQVTNIKLWTASTLSLFKNEAFIDAKGGFAYTNNNKLIKYNGEFTQPDYEDIKTNPQEYLKLFKLQEDLISIKPMYVKEPQIGGK